MRISPAARFHTQYGLFNLRAFETSDHTVDAAMWLGDLTDSSPLLVRVQSACVTSTALFGDVCDCAGQMRLALETIARERRGVFIYLAQEGRGLGLYEKVAGITAMNGGADTVTAYTERGIQPDARQYFSVGAILRSLGIDCVLQVMTNNPQKLHALGLEGFPHVDRFPLEIPPTELTRDYLLAKKTKLGHLLELV